MDIILVDLPTQQIASTDDPWAMYGSVSARSGIIHALAQDIHGFDRLIAYSPGNRHGSAIAALQQSALADRIKVMDHIGIQNALSPTDDVIVFAMNLKLWKALHLRWLCGSPRWPVTGITFSLSPWGVYRDLLMSTVGPIMPYDAIQCISLAAADVLDRLLVTIESNIAGAVRPLLMQTPLGIEIRDSLPSVPVGGRRELGIPDDAVVFLYFGRIEPRYKADLKVLLRAFSRLPDVVEAYLVMAGGSIADEKALIPLKVRCAELGIGDRVRWLPNVPSNQKWSIFSAADVFVSPVDSLQESFGISLLEAMACRLPVIASDWNGYRELVEDGVTGFLVSTMLAEDLQDLSVSIPLGDDYDLHWKIGQRTVVDCHELAKAMAELATNRSLCSSMGRAGRARVLGLFDTTQMVSRFRCGWSELLAIARGSAMPPDRSPYWYDHGLAFRAYPTHRLTRGTIVRAVQPTETRSSLFAPPPFLQRTLLLDLVRQLETPTAIAALSGNPQTNLQHVAYLVKQGLAEIVS